MHTNDFFFVFILKYDTKNINNFKTPEIKIFSESIFSNTFLITSTREFKCSNCSYIFNKIDYCLSLDLENNENAYQESTLSDFLLTWYNKKINSFYKCNICRSLQLFTQISLNIDFSDSIIFNILRTKVS